MICPTCFCLRTENRARKTHVFGVGWGGVGGACQCSLYFVHYSVLRCKDLWDRCYVACFCAADGVGWGGVGGACQRSLYFVHCSLVRCRDLLDRCYVTCYHAAEISGVVATWHDSTLLMGWGGVGWGACQRSLYFVHYSVLCCKDLWDRCYITCYYAATTLLISLGSLLRYLLLLPADNGACVAAMTVQSQKTRLNFSRFSNHQISTALW